MNWEAIGAIGEIIGAVGVMVTVVYLAYQIRQNTAQLKHSALTAKAAAVNASNPALRENRKSIFENADMAEIFFKGNREPSELSEIHQLWYRLAMQNVTEAILDIYSQTRVTNFPPETWDSQGVTTVRCVLGTDGGRWFWKR